MKHAFTKVKMFVLAMCAVLLLASVTAPSAEGISYIEKISVSYVHMDYKAGDKPQATAAVTEGNCTVAYEYWRELYQKEEGGVWSGTGRYWYSDPDKMNALPADKCITEFEAGHHYGYNIVLVTERGSFISDDTTIVSVGDHEWGTPGRNINLEIKEMSTKLYIYGIYAIDLPGGGSTDKVITDVSVVNVNTSLDSSSKVSFTARPASSCADKFDITEETWEAGGATNDLIKSTGTSRAPIAGAEYWYGIVLTAKDGYVFSKDFSDSRFSVKDGSGVTFTLNGVSYEYKFHVSDDGKTLTAWEFMNPITAKGSTSSVKTITEAVISGVKSDYQPGDVPQKSAGLPAAGDRYEIDCEVWEASDGAYWYSDSSRYTSGMKKITQFEEGKSYTCSIRLKTKAGYTFSDGCSVTVNGVPVKPDSVKKTDDGLLVTGVITITPTASQNPDQPKKIDLVEINGASVDINPGDAPQFTGKVPDGADYIYCFGWWETGDGKTGISSDESRNLDYEKLITGFEGGTTYRYGLCLKAEEGWCFTSETKLKINGVVYDYQRGETGSDETDVILIYTDLTVTPQKPDSGSTDDTSPAQQESTGTVPPSQTTDTSGGQTGPEKRGNPLPWIIAVLIIIAAASSATFYLTKKKQKK